MFLPKEVCLLFIVWFSIGDMHTIMKSFYGKKGISLIWF